MLGVSQCMLSCAPILVLYIAGTKEGWQDAVKATLVFSFSRLFAYVLLGLLAGLVGMFITDSLHNMGFSTYIWIGAGVFITIIGILIIFGKDPRLHFCRILMKDMVKNSIISMALLGFIVGFASYCAPLIAILTFISFSVKDPLTGAFYAFCFGLGSAIITPLLVMGIVAGILPRLVFRTPKILMIFRRSCGAIFLLLGARVIFNSLRGIW